MGACQKTGCSAVGEAEKPTPVRVLPVAVRLVMAWMPGPVRPWPAGSAARQAEPFGDVHTTTFWWPGVRPKVPAAVNVRPAVVSAVTAVRPTGPGSAEEVQVAPPLAELAANGTVRPAAVTAVPTAAPVRPRLVTCSSMARVTPAGSGRSACRQLWPSAEVQAEGRLPCAPTATKPARPAVAATLCRGGGAPPGRKRGRAGGDGRHRPGAGAIQRAGRAVPSPLPAGQGRRPPGRG